MVNGERLRAFRSNTDIVSIASSGVGALLLGWASWSLLQWGILDATWNADSYASCKPSGACWAVIPRRVGLILFGLYPAEERWRAGLAVLLVFAFILLLPWLGTRRPKRLLAATVGVIAGFLGLLYGGLAGLTYVPTDVWGGLALTLFLYLIGCLVGMPIGVMLALLRRSRTGWIAGPTAVVVDGVRSLPMVMVLFSIAVLAPLVFPGALAGGKLWRVALAFAFVNGCYQSEIVRAGLQAIPFGQAEAASALGLSVIHRMRLVLLPQAIANGFPATVNLLVAMFKETSIVAVIGFFDFTASAQSAYGNAEWANAYVEVYVFIAAIYFGAAGLIAWLGGRINRELRKPYER
ncbi:amino acid ABC transporter permease [Bradyrhizobium sp. KB893862 SZCCT0404]|uniref:amino acid ABC transporter permease n=1 Tax=Bradyrhizobium sp. KB893862 SZCCT0404 TaxID=2807672 RepID=UPI001BA8D622|nr:amino acid ABC transporter permease [Bradyrhizobium sp. KB893862 SZCCT0404]MBR1175225.1 amino acid ABC transporter permease [Bradyrhizobium sp. KB893862 SZCCT0404]